MAEALAAVSAAASIIQLLDFTCKSIARLIEYHSLVGEVPKVFRHINIELPVLRYTAQQLKEAIEIDTIDPDTKAAILPALIECETAVVSLHDVLEKLMPDPKDRWGKKQTKAIRSLFCDSDIEKSIKTIRQLIRSLVFASLSLKTFQNTRLGKLREWTTTFAATDSSVYLWSNQRNHLSGTGSWLLQSNVYKSWLVNQGAMLWLHGIPGCGKSVLSSSIIEDIQKRLKADPDKALAYFYFTFKNKLCQDPNEMVKSLIVQLAPQCIKISKEFDQLYASCGNGSQKPSPPVAIKLLRLVLQSLPETFIVMDALDECQLPDELLRVLSHVHGWKLDSLHLLFTSRGERALADYFKTTMEESHMIELNTDFVDKDIQSYVQYRLAHSKWGDDLNTCREIEAELYRLSQGMFRWAAFQLDAVDRCLTKKQLRETLKTLPKDLDETYERIILSIGENNRRFAVRLFRWLTFSAKPLRLVDLAEAAAIDRHRELAICEDEKFNNPLDVLSLCRGLIAPLSTDGNKSRVYDQTRAVPAAEAEENKDDSELPSDITLHAPFALSHFSVREYLVSNRIRDGAASEFWLDESEANGVLAGCCVSYLLHFQRIDPRENWRLRYESSELLQYCWKSWKSHAKAADPMNTALLQLLKKFLQTDYSHWDSDPKWMDTKTTEHPPAKSRKVRYQKLVSTACHLGMPSLVEFILESEDALCPASDLTRRLKPSARLLKITVYLVILEAAWLLRSSYKLNTVSGQIQFVLASFLMTLMLLMHFHTALEIKSGWISPLGEATVAGDEPTMEVLLKAGADVNYETTYPYSTPLILAVNYDHPDVVKHLIEAGANVRFGEALALAISSQSGKRVVAINSLETVRILLDCKHGVCAFSKYDEHVWTSILREGPPPAWEGGVGIVLHFIAAEGSRSRYYNSSKGTTNMMRLLMEQGAHRFINTPNRQGNTPLHLAVTRRDDGPGLQPYSVTASIVDFLVGQGACLDARNDLGATAMHLLVSYSHGKEGTYTFKERLQRPLETLLKNGAKIDEPDNEGRTVLHLAACSAAMTATILQFSPAVNQRDKYGNTPLHFAAARQKYYKIPLLLDHGADADATNKSGVTPLHLVCRSVQYGTDEFQFPWRGESSGLLLELKHTDMRFDNYLPRTIRNLCSRGARINAVDKNGDTPLHSASLRGALRAVHTLLDLGADANALNNEGLTPLDHIPEDSELVRSSWKDVEAMRYIMTKNALSEGGGLTSAQLKIAKEMSEAPVIRRLL